MKYNERLIYDRDYEEECLVCGRKEGKFYKYWDGHYAGEDSQIDPESAMCYTCGFHWGQVEPNFVERIYKEAKEYLKKLKRG